MKWACSNCKREIIDGMTFEDANVYYNRDGYWCRDCAKILKDKSGKEYLAEFPSMGRMIQETIFTDITGGDAKGNQR